MSKTIAAFLAACAVALPTAVSVAPGQANAASPCRADACPFYLSGLTMFWIKR